MNRPDEPARTNTKPVCLNTRGGPPTAQDFATVGRFDEILRALGWVAMHREVVDAVAGTGIQDWAEYGDQARRRRLREAAGWLTAARLAGISLAGIPLVGKTEDRRPDPRTTAAVTAAWIELAGEAWDELSPDRRDGIQELTRRWLTTAASVGLSLSMRAPHLDNDGSEGRREP